MSQCAGVPLACAEHEESELVDTLIRGSIRNSLPRNANGHIILTSPLSSARKVVNNEAIIREVLNTECDTNGNPEPVTPRAQGSPSSQEMDNPLSENSFSGSLEDLVSNFDEKITACFKDFTNETEQLAPVQIRTQDEIMSESQIWWTLTGNFGNILPIDWSKTHARELQMPALNLRPKQEGCITGLGDSGSLSEEDEELARALDLHSLIVQPNPNPDSPPQTADQVIEEIDEIMGGSSTASELTGSSDYTMDSAIESMTSPKSPLPLFSTAFARELQLEQKVREAQAITGSEQKLSKLSYKKLVALQAEMESLIQAYNETLVAELALKDELEYEKELKNTFISLLVAIQNKRRQANEKRKCRNKQDGRQPQYLTAVVPYEEATGSPTNDHLQALIKILRAVNDDSPQTTNMLTDYILNVLCPSSELDFPLPVNPMA